MCSNSFFGVNYNITISCFLYRYREPKHHQVILSFLKKTAGKWYGEKGMGHEFVLHLLCLDVPYLFSDGRQGSTTAQVATDFVIFLKSYVVDGHLEITLLNDMQSNILVS